MHGVNDNYENRLKSNENSLYLTEQCRANALIVVDILKNLVSQLWDMILDYEIINRNEPERIV